VQHSCFRSFLDLKCQLATYWQIVCKARESAPIPGWESSLISSHFKQESVPRNKDCFVLAQSKAQSFIFFKDPFNIATTLPVSDRINRVPGHQHNQATWLDWTVAHDNLSSSRLPVALTQ